MLIARSQNRKPKTADAATADALLRVSADRLREYVDMLAFPRHYVLERKANIKARNLLANQLKEFGYTPVLQGPYDNIVALPSDSHLGARVLLGAHYDSVPRSPGADDNASAVAVCLEGARILKETANTSAMIVFFNREEDGLLGSGDFVARLKNEPGWNVGEAHIFEMVGYRSNVPGSQKMPPGLPVTPLTDVGDFIALLANRHSNAIADSLVSLAATHLPQFPVLALKIYLGIEKYFSHLLRSDHTPFWDAGIPAVMWTDTSEFRNPHYHRVSDTPDTLDYEFMTLVTRLALARVMAHA